MNIQEYFAKIKAFCIEFPGWAVAFFLCGYVIGATYF